MDYCAPRGIPHSAFLKWSDDDQDKAIAWMLDREQVCSGCGTRADEYTDDDGEPLPGYVATTTRCYGCQELEELRERIAKDEETSPGSSHGLKLHLRPYDEARDGGAEESPDDDLGVA